MASIRCENVEITLPLILVHPTLVSVFHETLDQHSPWCHSKEEIGHVYITTESLHSLRASFDVLKGAAVVEPDLSTLMRISLMNPRSASQRLCRPTPDYSDLFEGRAFNVCASPCTPVYVVVETKQPLTVPELKLCFKHAERLTDQARTALVHEGCKAADLFTPTDKHQAVQQTSAATPIPR